MDRLGGSDVMKSGPNICELIHKNSQKKITNICDFFVNVHKYLLIFCEFIRKY